MNVKVYFCYNCVNTHTHECTHTVPLFSVLPGATSAAESDTTIVNTIQLVEGVLTYPIAITIQTNVTVVSPGNAIS